MQLTLVLVKLSIFPSKVQSFVVQLQFYLNCWKEHLFSCKEDWYLLVFIRAALSLNSVVSKHVAESLTIKLAGLKFGIGAFLSFNHSVCLILLLKSLSIEREIKLAILPGIYSVGSPSHISPHT